MNSFLLLNVDLKLFSHVTVWAPTKTFITSSQLPARLLLTLPHHTFGAFRCKSPINHNIRFQKYKLKMLLHPPPPVGVITSVRVCVCVWGGDQGSNRISYGLWSSRWTSVLHSDQSADWFHLPGEWKHRYIHVYSPRFSHTSTRLLPEAGKLEGPGWGISVVHWRLHSPLPLQVLSQVLVDLRFLVFLHHNVWMVHHHLFVGLYLELPQDHSEVILVSRCVPLWPQRLQSSWYRCSCRLRQLFACDCSMQALPVWILLGASLHSLNLGSFLVGLIHDSIPPVLRACPCLCMVVTCFWCTHWSVSFHPIMVFPLCIQPRGIGPVVEPPLPQKE